MKNHKLISLIKVRKKIVNQEMLSNKVNLMMDLILMIFLMFPKIAIIKRAPILTISLSLISRKAKLLIKIENNNQKLLQVDHLINGINSGKFLINNQTNGINLTTLLKNKVSNLKVIKMRNQDMSQVRTDPKLKEYRFPGSMINKVRNRYRNWQK